MNLARSSIKLFVANGASAGIQLLGITIFARQLGASEMGIFFLFKAALGILAIPTDFGIRGAVEKRISEGEAQEEFLSSAILLKLIPISIICLGLIAAQPFVNDYIGADIAIYLAVAIVLQEAARLFTTVLRGELRVGETAVLKVAKEVTWVSVGSLLIYYGYEAEGIIYSLLAAILIVLVWGVYKSSISLGRPSVTHARSLFDYGKFNVVSSIGGYFYSWMDVAIIGLFLTQAHVGAYEIAWRVTAISLLFSTAISGTIFPQVSKWSADGANDRIENLLPSLLVPSLFLVIPMFFGTLLYSREILTFVFGQEYAIASLVLILLMGEKVFQAIHVIIGKSLQAINKPDLAARATLVSVILNGVLNIFLVLEFGIIGAAVATVTSSMVNIVLHAKYLHRHIRLTAPYREIGECVTASLVMTGGLLALERVVEIVSILDLVLFIATGAIIYGASAMLLPNLRIQIMKTMERIGFSTTKI